MELRGMSLWPEDAERGFWRSEFYCQHVRGLDRFLIANSALINCVTSYLMQRKYATVEPQLRQWILFAAGMCLLALQAWMLHRRPQQYCEERNRIVLLARLVRIAFIISAYR
jgi:hypothetical protein